MDKKPTRELKYEYTDAEKRILVARSRMPYGAMLPDITNASSTKVEPLSMDRIASYMEALQKRLEKYAEKDTEKDAELGGLRAMKESLRSALGYDEILDEIRALKTK